MSEDTMFGEAIRRLHRDDPTEVETRIERAAVAIRDAWPDLDHLERMRADTLLAWAIVRAELRPLLDAAWSRAQSPWSLRNNVTATTDGTWQGLCAAIDRHLADCSVARTASFDGTADTRCRELLAEMQARHPRLGLSFGYVGNCGFGPGSYDDRSWMFFAKLATPACVGACDVHFGGHRTAYLGRLMLKAEAEIADWCAEQENRLDAREIRIVGMAA